MAPRRFALLFVAIVVGSSVAISASAKPKKRHVPGPYGPSSRVVHNAEAHGEATLRVRSIDLPHHVVVIELAGFPRAPAGNLFTFTDDRGRKFIATAAQCEEPFPSGTRVCDLQTPEGYERHPWVGLDLHLHGLQNSSVVAAPREEMERAYEAARSLVEDVEPDEPADGKPEDAKPSDVPLNDAGA